MASNTIVLKGMGHHIEGEADTVVLPGQCVDLQADGKWNELVLTKAESLKRSSITIAKEDALRGKTVIQAYAAADILSLYIPLPGDEIQVLVKSGQDIDIGEEMCEEGGGSGEFVTYAGSETRPRVISLEDSGGALGSATLMRARIL